MTRPPDVQVVDDAATLARIAADAFVRYVQEPLVTRGVAHVALAGGTTPRRTYELLAGPPHTTRLDYSLVRFYFGDERCVGPDDPASNFRLANDALLAPAGIDPANVFRIEGELGAGPAADRYDALLREQLGQDAAFDLVLLGLGEDGHTASLFPGGGEVEASGRLAVASHSPAGVPGRVTLTLEAINRARQVVFIVSGPSKADAVARILGGDESLPAARVQPAGRLRWLLDAEAAAGWQRP